MFNAHHEDLEFTLPPGEYGRRGGSSLDTAEEDNATVDEGDIYGPGERILVAARSIVVLTRPHEDDGELPASAIATGTRRAASPTGSTVRATDSPAPAFSPRAVNLMPRPAPRVTPLPAFAESVGTTPLLAVTERVT